jgi:hypothetical protein
MAEPRTVAVPAIIDVLNAPIGALMDVEDDIPNVARNDPATSNV